MKLCILPVTWAYLNFKCNVKSAESEKVTLCKVKFKK